MRRYKQLPKSYTSKIKATVMPCIAPIVQKYVDQFHDQWIDLKNLLDKNSENQVAQVELEKVERLRNELFAIRKSLDNNAKLSSVLELLQHEVRDETFKEKLNAHKDIFSITAGAIELRTATLRPRRRDDYCLRLSASSSR
jgi:hypothetical protein